MKHPVISALENQTPRYRITNTETGETIAMADLNNLKFEDVRRIIKDTLDGKVAR